jgi:hypothetical protein
MSIVPAGLLQFIKIIVFTIIINAIPIIFFFLLLLLLLLSLGITNDDTIILTTTTTNLYHTKTQYD